MMNVSIIGGSGYAGGEFVRSVHPNLRKRSDLKFSAFADLRPADVIFSALPHGVSMGKMAEVRQKAPIIIDLSADFRLRDAADYPKWYGHEHQDPRLLESFVYGVPELHREELRDADLISSAGCMAATSILGLYPLFHAKVVDLSRPVVVEAKTGSSGSGGAPGLGSHHPERSGSMRSFKPTGHRHSAEIVQELTVDGQGPEVAFSATAIEAVRGILATSHVFLKDPLPEKEIWAIYRSAYKDEPFMRLVKEASGVHRYPEPKLLSGSNWCDVGFERDPNSTRVVVMAALDNLMKGAAGQAVQAMNIRCGLEETAGLEFPGLHPI